MADVNFSQSSEDRSERPADCSTVLEPLPVHKIHGFSKDGVPLYGDYKDKGKTWFLPPTTADNRWSPEEVKRHFEDDILHSGLLMKYCIKFFGEEQAPDEVNEIVLKMMGSTGDFYSRFDSSKSGLKWMVHQVCFNHFKTKQDQAIKRSKKAYFVPLSVVTPLDDEFEIPVQAQTDISKSEDYVAAVAIIDKLRSGLRGSNVRVTKQFDIDASELFSLIEKHNSDLSKVADVLKVPRPSLRVAVLKLRELAFAVVPDYVT